MRLKLKKQMSSSERNMVALERAILKMLTLTEEAKLCTNTITYLKFANNSKFQSFNAVSNQIGTFPFLFYWYFNVIFFK